MGIVPVLPAEACDRPREMTVESDGRSKHVILITYLSGSAMLKGYPSQDRLLLSASRVEFTSRIDNLTNQWQPQLPFLCNPSSSFA